MIINKSGDILKANENYICHQVKNKEIERLNNIIKEVREYIESYNLEYLHETNEHNLADILEELLEILDKGDKEK